MTSGQRESPQCTNRLNTFGQKLFKQFQHQMTCTSLLHVRLFFKDARCDIARNQVGAVIRR